MYKYHCTNCGYVYNPYIWDIEQEVESWTDFEVIWEDWTCPVCWEWKDGFVEIIEKVHEISDLNDMLSQEEQHTPFWHVKNGKLLVEVWTEDECFVQDDVHFVEYIWVFDDSWDMIEVKDMPNIDEWPIEFVYPDYDDWEVRLSCSLHWSWRWIEKKIWE